MIDSDDHDDDVCDDKDECDCDNHTDYDDTDAKTRLSIKCYLYNHSTVKKSLLWVGRYIGKVRPPRGLDRISHFLVFLKI